MRLIVATGLGASGLTMGPYAGELAARAALGASLPLDLSPFTPDRRPVVPWEDEERGPEPCE